MIDYSSSKNLSRRCADVFYRGRPSQASVGRDGLGRGWSGAEERTSVQPRGEDRAISGRVSSVHGCSRGGAIVVRDGRPASGSGRRGEDGERASSEGDRSCSDQNRQAGFPNAGPPLKGGSDSGDLPARGGEPAGAAGDPDAGLLGGEANGSEEQDTGALGSTERRDSVGGGKAGRRAVQWEGGGVPDQVAVGGPRQDGLGRPGRGISGDPGSYQEVGRTGSRPLWRDRRGGTDRYGAGVRRDVVGVGGGRDCGRQTVSHGGRSPFLCKSDSLDVRLWRADISRAHHQAGERLAEMGHPGSGLSGDQEGPRVESLIPAADQTERTERGEDRRGSSIADDHLSRAHREEGIYPGHEIIGCLGLPLTDPKGSRSQLGLGAETECYGALQGADRRVVQKTEAAMKNKTKKEKGACVSPSQKGKCQIFCINLFFPFKPVSPNDLRKRSRVTSIS